MQSDRERYRHVLVDKYLIDSFQRVQIRPWRDVIISKNDVLRAARRSVNSGDSAFRGEGWQFVLLPG